MSFSCDICSVKCTLKENLKRHMRTIHGGEKIRHSCSIADCNSTFATNILRDKHLQEIHGVERKTYSCTQCDASFLQKSCLKSHIRFIHEGVQLKCDICDKSFARVCNLTQHVKTHKSIQSRKEEWKYSCDQCEAIFEYTAHLKAHIQEKHDLLRIQCTEPQCDASFSKQTSLNTHIKTVHGDERPFQCSTCLKHFKTKNALTQHRSVHVTSKDFSCSQCDATFASQDRLRQHMQMHNPVDLICPEPSCGMAFRWRAGLLNHKKIHTASGQLKQKKKEQHFADFLTNNEVKFKREHHIDLTCILNNKRTFFRIDFLIQEKGIIFMVELDEDAHHHYSVHCDTTRPFRICETLALEGNTLPIVIIRLNPDVYKVDGQTKRIYKIDRYNEVLRLIRETTSTAPLSVVYCYYPMQDGRLTIENDVDFNPHLKDVMSILPV